MRQLYLKALFFVIVSILSPVNSDAATINGIWALMERVKFYFTDTGFCATETDTSGTGEIIEYRYEGPYEIKNDTIVWFNKYLLKANLTSMIIDTEVVFQTKVENKDTFFLGINLNGSDVTIGNNKWRGSSSMFEDSSLTVYGYSETKLMNTKYLNIEQCTGDSLWMLQSAIENSSGIGFGIKVPLKLRHYRLYVWYCHPDSVTNRLFDYRINAFEPNMYDGVPNTDTVFLKVGGWTRFGPYHVDASHYLHFDIMSEAHTLESDGNVSVSGIEVNTGPSIRDVNTFRYTYIIRNDSLFLSPIDEALFDTVALCRLSTTVKEYRSLRQNYSKKHSDVKNSFNIMGRAISANKSNGVCIIRQAGKPLTVLNRAKNHYYQK